MPNHARTIGVAGAGTMGAGIAQLAAQAEATTLIYDPVPGAVSRAVERIGEALNRRVARGALEPDEVEAALGRIRPVATIDELAPCDLIIEAAPERLELKHELLSALAAVVSEHCVLATNTSSLPVTQIASAVPNAERVIGMHFFNPPPVMPLLEVVAGEASGESALALGRAVGEAMGKRVIDAPDVPGFLVNRVNRPFFLESLMLLEQHRATVEQIDRVLRLGGGFRMGPFELMDLVGIETNHAVAESMFARSYGEPRYRPSPLAARKVDAGHLGRKTGLGWYAYGDGRPVDPAVGSGQPPQGGIAVLGDISLARELRFDLGERGWLAERVEDAWLILDCDDSGRWERAAPRALLLYRGSLHERDPEAVGFHILAPLKASSLLEVTTTSRTDKVAVERLEQLAAALAFRVERVGDAPGLVLGRVVCQLINEAWFAIGAGEADQSDLDEAMELGVNHPRGPLAWTAALGPEYVVSVLDALGRELGEPRYRVAPALRQAASSGVAS